MDAFNKDQHIFHQAALQTAGLDEDLFEWLAGPYGLDDANLETARKNAVIARCVDPLAGLYLLLERDIVHLALRRALAFERAMYLGLLGNDAGGEIGIGDQ